MNTVQSQAYSQSFLLKLGLKPVAFWWEPLCERIKHTLHSGAIGVNMEYALNFNTAGLAFQFPECSGDD